MHGITHITWRQLNYLRRYRERLCRVGLAVTCPAAAGRQARIPEARIDPAIFKSNTPLSRDGKLPLGMRSDGAVTTVARPERTVRHFAVADATGAETIVCACSPVRLQYAQATR